MPVWQRCLVLGAPVYEAQADDSECQLGLCVTCAAGSALPAQGRLLLVQQTGVQAGVPCRAGLLFERPVQARRQPGRQVCRWAWRPQPGRVAKLPLVLAALVAARPV